MMRTSLVLAAVAIATQVGADERAAILRFAPTGPPGVGLTASGKALAHTYFRSPANERAGVWRAEPATTGPHRPAYSEFMYLLEGSVTLIDEDGRQDTFKAGDAVLVPRGTAYTWKQSEPLRKYYVIFDREPAGGGAPAAKATFIRMSPDGPAGTGLKGEGRTQSHRYFAGAGKSSAGVWETAPHTATGFHTTKYAELMVFLEGSGSLVQPDGEHAFKAGDVVLVPRGASYQWKSDRVRKFWVIFDNPATTAD